MNTIAWIIELVWFFFIAFWLVSALSAKRTVRGGRHWRWWALFRVVLFVSIYILIRDSYISFGFFFWVLPVWVAAIGVFVCVVGVTVAIWARVYLGRNWGMPMSLRENHELVMGGPYAYVRNPIYTGILLASLGTALVSPPWVLLFISFDIYFFYSTLIEEKDMARHFPDEYPAYAARTWRLVPFVW